MIDTMPHTLQSGMTTKEQHVFALPVCCPISKNPRTGSTLTINYEPQDRVLEVASLYAYIHSFIGGLRDDTGTIIVRDMEQMIERIAADCAAIVGTQVSVRAHLVLLPTQEMLLEVTAS